MSDIYLLDKTYGRNNTLRNRAGNPDKIIRQMSLRVRPKSELSQIAQLIKAHKLMQKKLARQKTHKWARDYAEANPHVMEQIRADMAARRKAADDALIQKYPHLAGEIKRSLLE